MTVNNVRIDWVFTITGRTLLLLLLDLAVRYSSDWQYNWQYIVCTHLHTSDWVSQCVQTVTKKKRIVCFILFTPIWRTLKLLWAFCHNLHLYVCVSVYYILHIYSQYICVYVCLRISNAPADIVRKIHSPLLIVFFSRHVCVSLHDCSGVRMIYIVY